MYMRIYIYIYIYIYTCVYIYIYIYISIYDGDETTQNNEQILDLKSTNRFHIL